MPADTTAERGLASEDVETTLPPLPKEDHAPQFRAWTRHARTFGLIMLLLVTAYGVYEFMSGDMSSALTYWRGKLWVLPAIGFLALLDVGLEGVAWMWVYHRFGIRTFDRWAATVFVAGRAGLLLPAQLGRLIRPDAMANLGRADLRDCLKAEAVTFALDSTSVGALIVGLVAWRVHPLLGPIACVGSALVALFVCDRLADAAAGTHLELPRAFWFRWQTFAILGVEMLGWTTHGLALWVLIRDLAANVTLWDPLFFAAASSVLGVSTGLPGGIGATEGMLGAALSWIQIPTDQLALTVGGFRIAVFWIWIPLGWAALALLRRRVRARRPSPATA